MDRFRVASEKFSSARRHLITPHPEGERAAVLAAVADVEAGLEALGDIRLVSDAAARSLELLKKLVPERNEGRFEWSQFAGAVDELASWLYWQEATAA